MGPAWTRRAFLASGVPAFAALARGVKGALVPPEWQRYADPATEFEVYRLTNPVHTCSLPAYYATALNRRDSEMLYWSDRDGKAQAYWMDLNYGESHQVTEVEALDGMSLNLLPDERTFCYFDGPALHVGNVRTLRSKPIYQVPQGWERCRGLHVSVDGNFAVFGESRGEGSRLRMVRLRGGASATLAEAPWLLSDPQVRPRRDQVLYRNGDRELWLVNTDGRQNRQLKTAEGGIGPALWEPSGRTVLYLNFPSTAAQLNAIRELTPDLNTDNLVAKTSQFVHFAVNHDNSVFVGASRNLGSPYLLLLLRVTRRELTICEHHASSAAIVAPVFSRDSQRIYFHSDRDGRLAIYRIRVDRLVERTDEGRDS